MTEPDFDVVFATSEAEIQAAQALRYDVFVRELRGTGASVDHDAALERDRFDPFSKHLLLLDHARGGDVRDQTVGAYRLLDRAGAMKAGGFYTEHEFDLDPLISSKHALLELGRSCVHADYRGGMAMYLLWSALAGYILSEKIDILFGVASFHGTDIDELTPALTLLHERHLASPERRPVARTPSVHVERAAQDAETRKAAMMQIPALIKAYLRLGGKIGQGAYLDHAFNTTDVCLVLDVANMSDKQRKLYTKGCAI